jgi:hypothetical protein
LSIVGAPSDTTRAAQQRDALGDLDPDAAVSVGAPRKEQDLDPPAFTDTVERASRAGDSDKLSADPQRSVRLMLGATDVFRGHDVVYARREGIDATYVIARSKAHTFIETLQ